MLIIPGEDTNFLSLYLDIWHMPENTYHIYNECNVTFAPFV